ncbi:N-acetyltransferase family protein [Tundrisphaera sp. TA3]|uniref:GNAT family N-acetyltransferase n=1 Tax=Tundrisphaera sp. TA3 TaxID=3435775 RepID=UPI003EBF1363
MPPTLRAAKKEDAPTIVEMIRELAAYEKLAHNARATVEDIERHLFGDRPAAEALIAEVDGTPVGVAIFYTTFSTFRGQPGLYLEDIYIRPEHRGQGAGTLILQTLASIAVERGYGRLEWVVLDWNEPAIKFYRSMGAIGLDGWTVNRVEDGALTSLARRGASEE